MLKNGIILHQERAWTPKHIKRVRFAKPPKVIPKSPRKFCAKFYETAIPNLDTNAVAKIDLGAIFVSGFGIECRAEIDLGATFVSGFGIESRAKIDFTQR